MQLSTPVQYFKYFITRDILEYISHQTILYSIQCCYMKVFSGTVEDLE
jgi:hypothetical protein